MVCSQMFDPFCQAHRRKFLNRVCLNPCPTTLICLLCMSSTHSGHDTDTVERAASLKREELQVAVQKAEAFSQLTDLIEQEERLRSRQALAREEIAHNFAALKDALERRQAALLSELELHVAEHSRNLLARRQAVSGALPKLQSVLQRATEALTGPDLQLLSSFDSFATELQEITASPLFNEALHCPSIELSLPTRDVLSQLNSFGSVITVGVVDDLRPSQAATSNSSASSAPASSTYQIRAIDAFEAMGLRDDLLRGIYSLGFEKPSAIQQRVIRPLIENQHIVAQSVVATGKTAAYSIGLLQRIRCDENRTQALVVVPTREQAKATQHLLASLGHYTDVRTHCYAVGIPLLPATGPQAHIAVATPGRMEDTIRRGNLRVDGVRMFIVDEADELLSRGYRDQILQILASLPSDVQVAFFSATLPVDTIDLANQVMKRPLEILCESRSPMSISGGKHFFVNVEKEEWKCDTLLDLLTIPNFGQSVVFCNSRATLYRLEERLTTQEIQVSAVHDKYELRRKEFRLNATQVLITTDPVAETSSVSVIINFDLPRNGKSYFDRASRPIRNHARQIVINLVTKQDIAILAEFQRSCAIQIVEMPADVETMLA